MKTITQLPCLILSLLWEESGSFVQSCDFVSTFICYFVYDFVTIWPKTYYGLENQQGGFPVISKRFSTIHFLNHSAPRNSQQATLKSLLVLNYKNLLDGFMVSFVGVLQLTALVPIELCTSYVSEFIILRAHGLLTCSVTSIPTALQIAKICP